MNGNGGRTVLVTGGAGFIGSNLAARLLAQPGTRVRIFDNFSRKGVEHNVAWLRANTEPNRLEVIHGNTVNFAQVSKAVSGISEIYHLAAQVAVTTSLENPRGDFDVNAQGTLNVLEAARLSPLKPMLIFTSTNKVYGDLKPVPVGVRETRYVALDPEFRGVTEAMPLDFHSPYGCSKGAADQYVRDYARIYDLPTVVFRMSCICGPRQFGNEDQGWVAHFLYSVVSHQPVNIYGDGFQVRDVLHVGDLLDAMEAVRVRIDRTRGQIFNVGGGMQRAVSVIEMLRMIELETGRPCVIQHSSVRPGDQPLYITDFSKLEAYTGWRPKRSISDTLKAVRTFWKENKDRISAQREVAGSLTEEVAEVA